MQLAPLHHGHGHGGGNSEGDAAAGDGGGAVKGPLLLRSLMELGAEHAPFARWLAGALSSGGGSEGGVEGLTSAAAAAAAATRVHPSVIARRFPSMGVGLAAADGGAVQVESSWTHSLKAPGYIQPSSL
jgi:hypothetical protein